MGKLGLAVYGRWLDAWPEVAAGTFAALLAWVIAQNVFAHPNPMFAAVIAPVCLPAYRVTGGKLGVWFLASRRVSPSVSSRCYFSILS